MGSPIPILDETTARARLLRDIGCIVAGVQRDGGVLHTSRHAAMLFATYPSAHFSVGRIVDELVAAAASAGVAVEISHPLGPFPTNPDIEAPPN